MFRHSLAIALLFILASVGTLSAQVPQIISYQGRIVANQVNFDGTGQFKFALVNAEGSASYWSNDGSSAEGSEPETAVALPVSKGLYSVLLGDATKPNMTILPATVFTHGDVHLRVWFNDGVHGFQQLSPDRRIAAVGYAMMAETVADGSITSAKLADGAVTSEKLAPNVVQSANLAPGAVGNTQLANPSITINAGAGLSGGGEVALGGNITLSNAGVLSLTGGNGITVDASSGAVTLGSSATSENTPNSIVTRDANGNFSAGKITASSFVGQGLVPWTVVSGTTQQAEPNMGYIASNASEVTITLPTAPTVGDVIRVSGAGAGGWKIAQNAGQQIDTRIISPPGNSWTPRSSSLNWTCIAASSDASRIIAGAWGERLYISSDYGLTWLPRESIQQWKDVAISSDGQKMVAVANAGQIYTSTDSGTSWTARDASRAWTCVASSANGSILYACTKTALYKSTNSGASWNLLREHSIFTFDHISCSANGEKVVIAGSPGNVSLSSDGGASFYIPSNYPSTYWFKPALDTNGTIYISGGGKTYIGDRVLDFDSGHFASSSNGEKLTSSKFVSHDSGWTWKRHNQDGIPVSSTSGDKILMAKSNYSIYTSTTNTTQGASGFLKGDGNSSIDLQFIGYGIYMPISFIGKVEVY